MPSKDAGLLSGEEIKSEGLIVDATDAMFRASTYDLTIGDVIPGGKETTAPPSNGEYRLAAGGMIKVVARESLKLPDSITGHALPRNTLCTRGVLAINIGIVDPGFEGPISSTLINFGAADFILKPGPPFLRVSFHRCPESPKAANSEKWVRNKYIDRVREQVLAYSANTFLNLEETVAKAGDRAFGKFKEYLLTVLAVAAAALALITVFVPLGASYVDRYLTDRRQWETETTKQIEQKVSERYADQLKSLNDEVTRLRDDVAQINSVRRSTVRPGDRRQ